MAETLMDFCGMARWELNFASPSGWARVFVQKRIQLQTDWLKGKILSTAHGAEVFDNIIQALNGIPWKEEGELGNVFRSFIKEHKTVCALTTD